MEGRTAPPTPRACCFARLMRCAIVVSGTMNARAISAVVRPPRARSVSEIADGGVRLGWQQRKNRIRLSSLSTGSTSTTSSSAERSSRRRREARLRTSSVTRRSATATSQPRGLSGAPSRGHCTAAASRASWTASSARAKSPDRRATAPRTCGASGRSRSSSGRAVTAPCWGRPSPDAPRTPAGSVGLRAQAPSRPSPRSRWPARGSRRRQSSSPRGTPWTRERARR